MDILYREAERDRWLKGDRHIRPLIRKIIRGNPAQLSGMQTVVHNFLAGLRRQNISYRYNRPSLTVASGGKVISFGLGAEGLKGLHRSTPLIAAIGFPYPSELPRLCEEYNVRKFLQHSEWMINFVKSAGIYPDHILDVWAAGIDTEAWRPVGKTSDKPLDVLIYNKVRWNHERMEEELVQPIRTLVRAKVASMAEIVYGRYSIEEYRRLLGQAKAMVFIAEHESQGIAYQECLSSGVPIIAWDQGECLDPARYAYGRPHVPATSVPFFDERCGITFADASEFSDKFSHFFAKASADEYAPRQYVLENLSIPKSTGRLLEIYNSI